MGNEQPSLDSMGEAPGMQLTFLKILILKHLHFGTSPRLHRGDQVCEQFYS